MRVIRWTCCATCPFLESDEDSEPQCQLDPRVEVDVTGDTVPDNCPAEEED